MSIVEITEIDPSLALQSAMVARLKADSKLAALGLGARVFDAVPPAVEFPFIKVGEDAVNVWDSVCGSDTEILSTVRVFSRKPGRVEAKQIAERVRFLLTDLSGFTVPDFKMPLGYCEGYQIEAHTDGLTHQAVIEFRYRLIPAPRLATGGATLPRLIGSAAAKLKIKAAAVASLPGAIGAAAGRLGIAAAGAMILPALMSSASATVFSPEMLFAASETGPVYDLGDLTSLHTGLFRVTDAGSPVRIMLDKSRMGGKSAAEFIESQPEIFAGAVSSGTPGYAIYNAGAGTWEIYRDGGGSGGLTLFTGAAETWYCIRLTMAQRGADLRAVDIRIPTGAGSKVVYNNIGASAPAGDYVAFVKVGNAASAVTISLPNTGYGGIYSNISVKQIPGFHAYAPSDAARSLYGREPVTGRRNLLLNTDFALGGAAVTNWTIASVAGITATVQGRGVDAAGNAYVDIRWSGTNSSGSSGFPGLQSATAAAAVGVAHTLNLTVALVAGSLSGGSTYALNLQWRQGSDLFLSNVGNAALTPSATPQKVTVSNQVSPANTTGARCNFGWTVPNGSAIDITLRFTIPQLEVGASATSYQRVTNALDVTEAGVASRHFLQPDGVDDWMQVLPTANLGATWSHVGGWRVDTGSRYTFTTRDNFETAIARAFSDRYDVWNAAGGFGAIATGAASVPAVLTAEQASFTSISGRYNGAGSSSQTLTDRSAIAGGIALFSSRNSIFNAGLQGRFYGGVWINRALTTAERAASERYFSHKIGIAA